MEKIKELEDLINMIKEDTKRELREDDYKYNNGFLGQEDEY